LQTRAKGAQVAVVMHVLFAERCPVAEDLLVDHRREPIQLEQRVLERGRGEQQLAPTLERPTQAPSHAVTRPIRVAQLVRLVDGHQVPWDLPEPFGLDAGEVDRHDQHCLCRKRLVARLATLAHGPRVEDQRGQVELLLQLQAPLLAK